jgi:hypothetical protein
LDLPAAISSVSGWHALNIKEVKNVSVTVVSVIQKTGADFNTFFIDRKFKELVQILILRRNCKNFIFNKANFAVECGRFGEKFNAVKNKIGQLQPRNQSLNKLLRNQK